MRKLFFALFTPFFLACANFTIKHEPTVLSQKEDSIRTAALIAEQATQVSWSGLVDGRVPVLLHYQMLDSLIVGELIYVDNSDKKPRKIVGTIDEFKDYRIIEIDSTGNINGIITGIPVENKWGGEWFSPKTRNTYSLDLKRVDTLIALPSQTVTDQDIDGHYTYQYSRKGQQGDLQVRRIDNNKLEFSIFSMTDEPARNIASIEVDTVLLQGTSFTYPIPDVGGCVLKVQFYKNFAYARYVQSDCGTAFGHNATLEGFYYKKP